MASPSSQASADRHRVTPVHAVPASRHSLHGSTARSPEPPRGSTPFNQRPSHPADLAQSRLFQRILMDEVDESEDLITAAVRRWERKDSETRGPMPHAILRLRERLTEARRLLEAINRRFPPD